MYKYIFKGKDHTDTTRQYMLNLGMNTEQIESVLQQKAFEQEQVKAIKAEAYARESDPLYIEWQKELAKGNPSADEFKQRWIDKTDEIATRFES